MEKLIGAGFGVAIAALLVVSGTLAQAQQAAPATGGQSATATAAPEKAAAPVEPAKKKARFKDPEDGAFDCSDYLLNHRGFLPVPFVITEPAVGYGGGLALTFFQESFAARQKASSEKGERMAPPNVGAVLGLKTSNGTWAAGGGYFGSLSGDRFRFLVETAKADMNLDFYGVRQIPRRFNIRAPFVIAHGLARLGRSDWFAGAGYLYFGGTTRFDPGAAAEVEPWEMEADLGILSLLVDYDSRDNVLTASRGTFAELDLGWARPELGSTTSYQSQHARGYTYLPVGERLVVGLRGDLQLTSGSVPFYALPYLTVRGIPAMRYQGQNAAVAETEVRFDLGRRWGLVAFLGAGRAYGSRIPFSEAETAIGGGLGYRHLIARRLGMWAGVGVARGSGTEDTAIYFQVGSAWR